MSIFTVVYFKLFIGLKSKIVFFNKWHGIKKIINPLVVTFVRCGFLNMLLKITVQRNVGSGVSVGVNCGVLESLKAYLRRERKLDSKIIPSLFFSAFFFFF